MSMMTVLVPRFATVALRSTCRVLHYVRPSKAGYKYQTSHTRNFLATQPKLKKDKITVYFIDRDGDQIAAPAAVGESLLDVALNNSIELEEGEKTATEAKVNSTLLDVVIDNDLDIAGFGACEGTMACSTCHLILPKDFYNKLPCPPSDEEQDILDMAFGLTDTSRLGCQVYVTEDMDGLEVKIPVETSDVRNIS
ncbi:FDX1 [Acanthosepion pharaonis]|uniref:FDX1 n=1 Tax=Acanthosepion pharaonis TaxID=158019 RepID=A0A812CHF8_ACAPH|nr:FDX1 [Sepia pharaonis]